MECKSTLYNIIVYILVYKYAILFLNIPRYAAGRIQALRDANQLRPRSRFASWRPVSMEEMRAVFAILLNMGLIDVPTLEGYWTTAWESEVPFFGR